MRRFLQAVSPLLAAVAVAGLIWSMTLLAPSNRTGVRTMPPGAGAPAASSFVIPGGYLERAALAAKLNMRSSVQLKESMAAPLSAGTSPVAILGQGGTLVYASWKLYPSLAAAQSILPGQVEGRPSIRALNLASGSSSLIVDGANSFALSGDRLAYVLGTTPDYTNSKPYLGTIHVRNLGDPATDVVLEGSEADWRIAAWAGDTLLAYQQGEGESLNLFSIKPDGSRSLTAANSGLVAVSPDGTQAAITSLEQGAILTIVDLATGAVVSSLNGAGALAGNVSGGLMARGDWDGSRIVAALRDRPGYAIVTTAAGVLAPTSVQELDQASFPWGVATPTFADDGAVTLTAFTPGGRWGGTRGGHVLTCFSTCQDDPVADPLSAEPQRVYNPSRPLKGGL